MYHIHFNRWKPAEKLTGAAGGAAGIADYPAADGSGGQLFCKPVPAVYGCLSGAAVSQPHGTAQAGLENSAQNCSGRSGTAGNCSGGCGILGHSDGAAGRRRQTGGCRHRAGGRSQRNHPLRGPANPHRRGGSLPESKPRHSGGAVRRAWAGREYLRGAGHVQRPDGAGH